jgi:polar amino acid transport system permease protein
VDFQPDIFLEALTSQALLQGALVTVALTIVSFVGGLLIGLLIALMHESRLRVVRAIAWTYVWIFRAIPALILLFIVWFALPQLFPVFREEWFVPFLAASIALAINEAAYAAEILRGGLMAVDDGQRLAARSLGMRPAQVFRKVIAPQLTRVTIPPMSNDFVAMLKTTSLASVVSVRELMTNAQTAVSSTFRFAEWYGAAAVYYLVLVSIFMVGQAWLERRYVWTSTSRAHRRRSVLRAIGR